MGCYSAFCTRSCCVSESGVGCAGTSTPLRHSPGTVKRMVSFPYGSSNTAIDSNDLSWIENAGGIKGGLDAPHQLDLQLAQTLAEEGALCMAHAVLA